MAQAKEQLERRMHTAEELHSVVRTMKALAAVSIGPYERAAASLKEYNHTVERGMAAALKHVSWEAFPEAPEHGRTLAIVFGSDQGMVGPFNEKLASFVAEHLEQPEHTQCWPVGERIAARLADYGVEVAQAFHVPDTVQGITPLTGALTEKIEAFREQESLKEVLVFHHVQESRARYHPRRRIMLPLRRTWQVHLARQEWETRQVPELAGDHATIMAALLREYFFVTLFMACAESAASEHASRLAAMQRAEQNIQETLEELTLEYHQARQQAITEELMDVVSGFEALTRQ